MKKFKKIMAAVMATAAMAISVTSLSASAYSPTITKSFLVGSVYANAEQYHDSSQANASTSLSGGHCSVSLSFAGQTASRTNVRSNAYVQITGRGSKASSSHSATLNGYSGSTSIVS